MGKTAVFVLSTLQQLEPKDGEVHVLVMCHTRELAVQIEKEYVRFTKYFPEIKTSGFYGGIPISNDTKTLEENCPVIKKKKKSYDIRKFPLTSNTTFSTLLWEPREEFVILSNAKS